MFGDLNVVLLYRRNRHRDICLPTCWLYWEKPHGYHQDLLIISLILLYMEWYHQAAVWFAEAPKRSWMIIFYFLLDAQSPWPWASTSAEIITEQSRTVLYPTKYYLPEDIAFPSIFNADFEEISFSFLSWICWNYLTLVGASFLCLHTVSWVDFSFLCLSQTFLFGLFFSSLILSLAVVGNPSLPALCRVIAVGGSLKWWGLSWDQFLRTVSQCLYLGRFPSF